MDGSIRLSNPDRKALLQLFRSGRARFRYAHVVLLVAGIGVREVHDLLILLRVLVERGNDPSAVIFDARALQSTPESGGRAGFDWRKKSRAPRSKLPSKPWETCWPST